VPIGVVLTANANATDIVDDVISQARHAFELGVRQVWLGQAFDYDAIALAALVGAAASGLGVGTSAVPINPRHPLIVASQAQTAQAAAHGNFSLGLALGAHAPEQQAFGTRWPHTIARLREHLTVLQSVFHAGSVDFHGEQFTAAPPGWPVAVAGGAPVPVYVAAMGPKAANPE
jgi:alkanesulfonate monooxygenase SsuD/methylene tetrahydromethanopterin reductase-like flavin-dependent oxidoreductase (luciferase family)